MKQKNAPGLTWKVDKKNKGRSPMKKEKIDPMEKKAEARGRMLSEIDEFKARVEFEDEVVRVSDNELRAWFYQVWHSGEVEMEYFEKLFKLGGAEVYAFLAEILEEGLRDRRTGRKLGKKDKLSRLEEFIDKGFNYRGASMVRVQANPAIHNERMIDSYDLAKNIALDEGFMFERIFSVGAPAFTGIDSLDIAGVFVEIGKGLDDYVIADRKVFGLTEHQVVDLLIVDREFGLNFFAEDFVDKNYLIRRLIDTDKLDEDGIRDMSWEKWDLTAKVREKLAKVIAK